MTNQVQMTKAKAKGLASDLVPLGFGLCLNFELWISSFAGQKHWSDA
jgi:hypothetical protein